MDFKNYKFRASQLSKIMGGTIEKPQDLKPKIEALQEEKDTGFNANGNKTKWTATKEETLKKLVAKVQESKGKFKYILPKTMESELRKIYRSEKHNRNFLFTNKFIQKGIAQENQALTLLQNYLNKDKLQVLLGGNVERKFNDYVQGLPDNPVVQYNSLKTGFDIKSSWNLDTLPFKSDKLNVAYEYQDYSYIWLFDADQWITAYVLVNIHEHGLNNEKQKFYYANQMPDEENDKEGWDIYIENCRDLEKSLIFDYDDFVKRYPSHDMAISRAEWMDNGWNIPMEKRVVLKKATREEFLKEKPMIIERIEIAREYLTWLEENE